MTLRRNEVPQLSWPLELLQYYELKKTTKKA